MHALLIHQCMHIHQTECLFTTLINTTNLLRHFTLLYATLLPFAPLCAPLRYFTLLYSTLLYLGTSTRMYLRKYRNGLLCVSKRTGTDFSGYRNGPEHTSVIPKRTLMGTRKGRVGYDRNVLIKLCMYW